MQPFQLHRFGETREAPVSKKKNKHKKDKHNGGEPEPSVLRDVKEAAAVQERWHLAEQPKARKPPKDYK